MSDDGAARRSTPRPPGTFKVGTVAGSDVLIGYGGSDTFAFTTGLGAGNVDIIEDFVSGTDRIALDDWIFNAIVPGALAAGAFVVAATAQDGDDRILLVRP